MTEIYRAQIPDPRWRLWSEFSELPGLRLTCAQACRLCAVDQTTGARALEELVEAAVLRRIGPYYVRADLSRFSA